MEIRIKKILGDINEKILEAGKEENLFSGGLLDSIDLMELISELEEEFKLEIYPEEIELNNFESVEKIVSFINKKTGNLVR